MHLSDWESAGYVLLPICAGETSPFLGCFQPYHCSVGASGRLCAITHDGTGNGTTLSKPNCA